MDFSGGLWMSLSVLTFVNGWPPPASVGDVSAGVELEI